jgi:hypothetical protein
MRYLVALQEGGIMERPQITLSNFQVIEANSREEAWAKYNTANHCSYYYGTVIASKNEIGEVVIFNRDVTLQQLDLL